MSTRPASEINSILKCFKQYYPSLDPKTIYQVDNGYLIFAPLVENGTDYGNPYYFVDDQFETAAPLNMKYHMQLNKAFDSGPIWTKDRS